MKEGGSNHREVICKFLQKSIIPGVINLWNEITIYNMVV